MDNSRKWQNTRQKKQRQQLQRGWSDADIDDIVINHPGGTASTVDRIPKPPEAATVYYRTDGHYVIINDSSGEIVQMSDRSNFDWIDEQTNQRIVPRPIP